MIGETSYFGSDFERKPIHYVSPHWVNSYVRKDGTFVRGFWRDGDGDTTIDRTTGYFAGNPIGRVLSGFGNSDSEDDLGLKDMLCIMAGYYAVAGGVLATREIKDRLSGGKKDRA